MFIYRKGIEKEVMNMKYVDVAENAILIFDT